MSLTIDQDFYYCRYINGSDHYGSLTIDQNFYYCRFHWQISM